MKLLLKILGGLAALLLLLVLVAFFLPRQYRVERTLVIKAAPATVLAQVADLKAWKNWGAWQERDPGMKLSYSVSPASGVGAWSAWESAKEGNGKMTITALSAAKVAYDLEFPDMGTTSKGSIELVPDGAGTRVVWVDAGDLGMNPMARWFGLFLDQIIGPDFERGLVNIRKLVEK
ncbi:MAG: SRPBCC family protein [Verrucomicrobia bacterium]|nr:SRPBCC family protein [Verrucomicrobiota bacterium]